MSSQQSITTGQSSAASSSSYKSTTVSITVQQQSSTTTNNEVDLVGNNVEALTIPDLTTTLQITPNDPDPPSPNHPHQQFTTLIAKEKSLHLQAHNEERESTSTNKHKVLQSTNPNNGGSTIILLTSNEQSIYDEEDGVGVVVDEDEEQVQCDQEINRITNSNRNSSSSSNTNIIETSGVINNDEKVIISLTSSSSSPEPSGNLELVGLMMTGDGVAGTGTGGGQEVVVVDSNKEEGNGGDDQHEFRDGGGGVEFEEFVLGDDIGVGGGGVDVDLRFSVSSKVMKSSKTSSQSSYMKSTTSSIQQQSSIEKVSSEQQVSLESSATATIAKGEVSVNQSVISSNQAEQQSVTMTNGSGGGSQIEEGGSTKTEGGGGKKTKVERKTSKAGGKKNKSNAEISKENISVTSITNGSNNSSSKNGPPPPPPSQPNNPINSNSINGNQNHHISNNIKPIIANANNSNGNGNSNSLTHFQSTDDLVKKLGPGESRVFAKVCVANLRRSFGDLTVINSMMGPTAPTSTSSASSTCSTSNNEYNGGHFIMSSITNNNNHNNNRYCSGSNSLEYNRINSINNKSNSNSLHHHHNSSASFNSNSLRDLKKSSFSKFDSLVSKNQQQQQENGDGNKDNGGRSKDQQEATNKGAEAVKKMFCASCEKQVFQMELIRAEKKDFHKNCFRCCTCRKVLGVDTYQSHEQRLYCKPHFKELFQPKKVVSEEEDDVVDMKNGIEDSVTKKKSKLQLIICESQPKELPPDVVRASDTPSTGLEDIQIDVRSKFEMFENLKEQTGSKSPVLLDQIPVKRSASVLAKLKKYENSVGTGGSELNGVSDEDLHGVDGIELQSEEEEDLDGEEGGNSVIKDEIKRKLKNPLQALNEIAHFKQMEQVRSKWEEGTFTRDQMISEQRKEELQKFRSRLCQGKSNQLKEMYEKGVETGGEGVSSARSEIEELKVDKAKAFREMFEKGEVGKRRFSGDEDGDEVNGSDEGDGAPKSRVDLEVFEAGVAKESKRLFEELDKKVLSEMKEQKSGGVTKSASRFIEKKHNSALVSGVHQQLASSSSPPTDIVRSSDKKDDFVKANTEELSSKFKFFETYEDELARKAREAKRDTLKRITPPREDGVVKTEKDYEDDSEESHQTYRDPTVVRHGEVTQEDPLQHSKTTSKMLSVFRQMEENLNKGDGNNPIIRPLKQFTPPRDTIGTGVVRDNSDEDEEEEEEEEEGYDEEEDGEDVEKRMSEDEFLKEVGSLARARSLRAKFERWEQQENERNKQQGAIHDELAESIESAKNLKAKFEAMRLMGDTNSAGSNKENLKGNSPVPIRVNRFVLNTQSNNHHQDQQSISTNSSSASTSPHQLYCNNFSSLPAGLSSQTNGHHHHTNGNSNLLINSMSSNEQCAFCEKRVYVMEKVEAGGKMYHKNCFRCSQCKCILRMDTFTSNKGTLFCTTHFKQLFKIKGNYDEGFGHETQYQQWAKKHAAPNAATAQPN